MYIYTGINLNKNNVCCTKYSYRGIFLFITMWYINFINVVCVRVVHLSAVGGFFFFVIFFKTLKLLNVPRQH